jgi:hypothetical protein
MNNDKKAIMKEISEKTKAMKQLLREAQKLADKHGLSFKVAIDLPPGARDPDGYAVDKVAGTYHGKGTEEVDIDDEGNSVYNEHGKFYWENSSLNC